MNLIAAKVVDADGRVGVDVESKDGGGVPEMGNYFITFEIPEE